MSSPIIHIAAGSLMYLLAGDLNINRIYILVGVVLLSVLPDFDFIIPGPHRGFSHSLVFCIAVTILVGTFTSFSYLTTFAILMSHLLLDSFADGFYSVSWLWPFQVHHSPVSYALSDLPSIVKDVFRVF